jgi:hypothetical protein
MVLVSAQTRIEAEISVAHPIPDHRVRGDRARDLTGAAPCNAF